MVNVISKKLTETPIVEWPTKEQQIVVLQGDTREIIRCLPDDSIQCVVTSPPYWGVRDYGISEQIGAEMDLTEYIKTLVNIFREVRRVLKADGTFWLNIGNTYTSGAASGGRKMIKTKDVQCHIGHQHLQGLRKKIL